MFVFCVNWTSFRALSTHTHAHYLSAHSYIVFRVHIIIVPFGYNKFQPNDAKEKITGAFKDIINRSSLAEPIFLNNRRFYSIKNGAEDVKFFLQFSPSFCPFIYINRFDFDDLDNQLQWRKHHSSAIDKSLDCEEYKCSCEEACRIYLFRFVFKFMRSFNF